MKNILFVCEYPNRKSTAAANLFKLYAETYTVASGCIGVEKVAAISDDVLSNYYAIIFIDCQVPPQKTFLKNTILWQTNVDTIEISAEKQLEDAIAVLKTYIFQFLLDHKLFKTII